MDTQNELSALNALPAKSKDDIASVCKRQTKSDSGSASTAIILWTFCRV
ncbi:MAG: hypothetical protein LBT83_04770 [Tannerella sp.]|jgi:hypothetical protein|nr:hypothetical protein [Tannerella sp.]